MTQARQHYRSLLLAGVGSVGCALLRLGGRTLAAFEQIILVDRDSGRLPPFPVPGNVRCLAGDVEEPGYLRCALAGVAAPGIVVNLCAGVDTVALRRDLCAGHAAYIDAGASRHPDAGEVRFSRTMPYTVQEVGNAFPHLVCQGVNPGLVEVVARGLMRGFPAPSGPFSVLVLEEDTLHVPEHPDRPVCGWSPPDLIEEMLLAPTLQVAGGEVVESAGPGSIEVALADGVVGHFARAVGHEDIWNLGQRPEVSQALFLYRLHDGLMEALRTGSGDPAGRLALPTPGACLGGTDDITVAVCHLPSGAIRAQHWAVDHQTEWLARGLNGVQVQTAKGILFAVELLRRLPPGRVSGTYTASSLPWALLEAADYTGLFASLGIGWQALPSFRLDGSGAAALRLHPDDRIWR